MLGIETGEAVYIAGAALGITALLAAAPVALTVLRYGGAAYLVLLGVRAWRQGAGQEPGQEAQATWWRAYGRGLVVQLLNPKVAVFFLAYFPQFISADRPAAPQVLALGAVYLAIAVTIDASYVLLASWLTSRIAKTEPAARRRARFSALTYFALAGLALISGDHGAAARALAPDGQG